MTRLVKDQVCDREPLKPVWTHPHDARLHQHQVGYRDEHAWNGGSVLGTCPGNLSPAPKPDAAALRPEVKSAIVEGLLPIGTKVEGYTVTEHRPPLEGEQYAYASWMAEKVVVDQARCNFILPEAIVRPSAIPKPEANRPGEADAMARAERKSMMEAR